MKRTSRENRLMNHSERAGDVAAVEIERVGEGNSEQYRITINTADNGGQPLMRGTREVKSVSFTVVGVWEMAEIADLLPRAYRDLR